MANLPPVKYDTEAKNHKPFASGDIVDPVYLPAPTPAATLPEVIAGVEGNKYVSPLTMYGALQTQQVYPIDIHADDSVPGPIIAAGTAEGYTHPVGASIYNVQTGARITATTDGIVSIVQGATGNRVAGRDTTVPMQTGKTHFIEQATFTGGVIDSTVQPTIGYNLQLLTSPGHSIGAESISGYAFNLNNSSTTTQVPLRGGEVKGFRFDADNFTFDRGDITGVSTSLKNLSNSDVGDTTIARGYAVDMTGLSLDEAVGFSFDTDGTTASDTAGIRMILNSTNSGVVRGIDIACQTASTENRPLRLVCAGPSGAPSYGAMTFNRTGASALFAVTGDITATGTITPSDQRLKRNIKPVTPDEGIRIIQKLRPVRYEKTTAMHMAEGTDYWVKELGTIAQDHQFALPDAVAEGADGYLTVRDKDTVYALVAAVQHLDKMVGQLMRQIQDMEERNNLS